MNLSVYPRILCRFYPKQSLNVPDNVPIYASIKLIEYAGYMCTGRREHNGCQKTQARKNVLEDFVVDVTLKALNHDNVVEVIADKLIESQDERLNDKSTQAILKKQKA